MQKNTKKQGPHEVGATAVIDLGTPQAGPAQDHPDRGGSAEAHPESGGLGQIQDILLGPLSQSFEQKLNQVEQRLDRSLRDFSEQTSARIEEYEKRTDDKLARLNEDIKRDRERHSKANDQLKQECDAAVKAVREKMNDKFKQYEKTQVEFDEMIRTRMAKLYAKLTGRLDTEVERLLGQLVDRASLASAFSDAALRISGQVENVAIDSSDVDPEIDAALANLKESPGHEKR